MFILAQAWARDQLHAQARVWQACAWVHVQACAQACDQASTWQAHAWAQMAHSIPMT